MTISQALKEKNRILNSIKKIKEKIKSHNQIIAGTDRPYNISELYDELISQQKKLVNLKASIHRASSPVRDIIFEQSELKDRLVFIKSIPSKNGIVKDRYSSDDGYEVESKLGPIEIDSISDSIENAIDAIQDKLDRFNHTTEVDF